MEYKKLVDIYEALNKTSKRLEKTEILAEFLKKCKKEDLRDIVYLLEGRIFPQWEERKIGFSNRLMIKAVSVGSGESISKIENLFRKKGDLGLVAEEVFSKKKQTTLHSKKLDSEKVLTNIRKLASLEGAGTVGKKISFVSELLGNASALEAKYIVKIILENLRIGVSSGVMRDSIAKTFNLEVKKVEKAADLSGDYGEVAELAKSKNLKSVGLKVGKPVKCMLAIKVDSVEEGFEAIGKPALIDYKLDGFRVMVHKKGDKFWFFTRRMENVLNQFKELVEVLKENVKGKSYILDTEVVGYDSKTKNYLPFQSISQRIKRKYNIEEIAKKFPVEINAFDVLYYNGKNLMCETLDERRKILKKIIKEREKKIKIPEWIISDKKKKTEEFYKKALREGVEGVMMKNLKSDYRPGRYVGGWVKVKTILEPLDVVILGAETGEGKRTGWLTSYVIACKSGDKFLEVGKVSTGVKEKAEGMTYKEMTKLLKSLIISRKGKEVKVKPKIVIEVGYEEIQKSSKYSSGYALRFPRFLKLRTMERKAEDVNTIEDVKRLYHRQKKT